MVTKITEGLYIGKRPEDCEKLSDFTIISLSDKYCDKDEYCLYPVPDGSVNRNILLALLMVKKKLDEGKKVYVHCEGGCGRSGTLAAAWLILFEGLDAIEAVNRVFRARGCGPETEVQLEFLEFLEAFKGMGIKGIFEALKYFK